MAVIAIFTYDVKPGPMGDFMADTSGRRALEVQ